MKLTKSQLEAIKIKEGNVLVSASFGGGKSAVYVSRIANLIANENVSPGSILGLTFTKEAANNVRRRLESMIGEIPSKQVLLTTFHSFAYRVLKSNYPEVYNHIKIVESWFENQIAQGIVSERNSHNQDGHDLKIHSGLFLDFVSYQKVHMVRKGYPIIVDNNTSYVSHIDKNTLQSAYNTYCNRMTNAQKMSFDDILLDFFYKLLEDEELLESLREKYKYILVDEFQDSSIINLEILKLINDSNLYVVGDVNQSIYSFIGAEAGNILEFKDDFEDVKVISLLENFRSTSNIIGICNDLLQYRGENHPLNSFGKQVSGRNIEGNKVKMAIYNDEYTEASEIVADIIARMEDDPSLEYKDFCIISRTNNGLLAFENELSSADIPVIMSSGGSFYDRREIDDLLSYAKLHVGHDDDAFRKVFNRPNRYLSNAMLRDLEAFAYEKNVTIEKAISLGFNAGKFSTNLNRFIYTIEDIRDINRYMSAEKVLRKIYELTRYRHFIEEKALTNSEIIIKEDAIERLFASAKKFKSIEGFINYVSVVKQNTKKEENGVILSTVHSSKGLEWDTVYVVGVTDNNYPHEMLLSEDKDEELRLLFVALGRAKNHLQISIPIRGAKINEPSRFIKHLLGDEYVSLKNDVLGGMASRTMLYNANYKGSEGNRT